MFAVSMAVILACSGLAIDIGRMYVTRTEAQSFVDALALAKAAEYIGARQADASDVWKRYNFNNDSFDGHYTIGYSSTFGGTYGGTAPESGPVYVRATATVDVPLTLLKVLVPDDAASVSASAVAVVEQVTSLAEGGFPIGVRERPGGFDKSDIGVSYTIRWDYDARDDLINTWAYVGLNIGSGATLDQKLAATAQYLSGSDPFPSAPKKPNIAPWCAGDATPEFLQYLLSLGINFSDPPDTLFRWDGLYYKVGTSFITESLAFGYQEQVLTVGGSITYAPGKEGEPVPSTIWDVVDADTNQTTQMGVNPPTYLPSGNGYRLFIVPIVSSDTYMGEQNGAAAVTGLEAFVLQVRSDYPWDEYDKKGNWCATYYGAMELGTGAPVDQPNGIWRLRLVS